MFKIWSFKSFLLNIYVLSGNLCTVGDRCTNKRFQKMQSASVEAFATEKKGLGIRAVTNIPRLVKFIQKTTKTF